MPQNKKRHTKPPGESDNITLPLNKTEENKQEPVTIRTSETEKNTDTMEAYHPHGNHHNRRFKDYLVEFLMMFIAISGGFFMENMREHRVDRHKEKEYIVRLIRDIKEDTATVQRIIRANQNQIKGLDSLIRLLEKPVPASKVDEFNNLTFVYLNNYRGFTPRDITITQLRNSGGLRLIENNSISDSIVNYYSTIEHYHEVNVKMNYRFVEDTYKLELQFIDMSLDPTDKKQSITDDNRLKELKNRCFFFKPQIKWDNIWLNDVYRQGISLLKNLQQEYHIRE